MFSSPTSLVICVIHVSDQSCDGERSLSYLDVCAIASSDDQASVQDELHVTVLTISQGPRQFELAITYDVPEASVPAVEMCSEISEAGQMISAFDTL